MAKLTYNPGEFPVSMIVLKQTENEWLSVGDTIYACFKDDDQYYVSWGVTFKSTSVIIKAMPNDNLPVKTGFDDGEHIYWAVETNGVAFLLNQDSTYQDQGITCGLFSITDDLVTLNDNPYYILQPIWPDIYEHKIFKPVPNKIYYFYNINYSPLQPKYTQPGISVVMVDGTSVIYPHKYLNSHRIKFSSDDVIRGYVIVKFNALPLQNSGSQITSKDYKLYWE